MSDSDFLEKLQSAGCQIEGLPIPVGGTGNNRAYKVRLVPGNLVLVKQYFQHPSDPRDRFATECAFYEFVWNAEIRRTPRPLTWLTTERMALFEFIEGNKPTSVDAGLVDEAVAFFLEVNAARRTARAAALPTASEACFSLREHLACVQRRFDRLAHVVIMTDLDEDAARFVQQELVPAWQRIHGAIVASHSDTDLDSGLPAEERCISPSDFGFHNTLRTAAGDLRFIDFEYAGWDDPAKTVCDFFCQPAIPVPLEYRGDFIHRLQSLSPSLPERVATLFPVYQLKWCCIMLNDFLPGDGRRRVFSNPGENIDTRKLAQLAKARHALAHLAA